MKASAERAFGATRTHGSVTMNVVAALAGITVTAIPYASTRCQG
jgi:hypothetical protein